MRRWLSLTACLLAAGFPLAPAGAQDSVPGANLSGYDSLASASLFSLQPFLPAFLPTDDVPFEVTLGLTNSRVQSGGNSFGRAALLYPGSALANLGPLLMAAGPEGIGAAIPPYPLQVEASQIDGEVETSVPPLVVMRARGFPDEGSGESRLADIDLPGVVRVDSMTSTSSSVVTADEVTSTARAVLNGVSLLGGTITVEEVRSVVRTTSTGRTASSSGTTDLVGLRIVGFEVSVTDRGFEVVGVPEGPEGPVPGTSPQEALNDLLEALGISLVLFEGSVTEGEGRVQRFEPGLVMSIDSPIPETGPIPPGRFDIFLATVSASATASPPFLGDFGGEGPSGGPSGVTSSFPAPLATLGRAAEVDPFGAGGVSQPGGSDLPGQALGPSAPAVDYSFGGVPLTMALGLLLAALIAAWYVRGFLRSIISSGEGDG